MTAEELERIKALKVKLAFVLTLGADIKEGSMFKEIEWLIYMVEKLDKNSTGKI